MFILTMIVMAYRVIKKGFCCEEKYFDQSSNNPSDWQDYVN